MEITLTSKQLDDIVCASAKRAVLEVLSNLSSITISQREAFKRYGRGNVERWIKDGTIEFKRNGKTKTSTLECSLIELEKQKNKELLETKYYENQGN